MFWLLHELTSKLITEIVLTNYIVPLFYSEKWQWRMRTKEFTRWWLTMSSSIPSGLWSEEIPGDGGMQAKKGWRVNAWNIFKKYGLNGLISVLLHGRNQDAGMHRQLMGGHWIGGHFGLRPLGMQSFGVRHVAVPFRGGVCQSIWSGRSGLIERFQASDLS